jgi:hypothetical protein
VTTIPYHRLDARLFRCGACMSRDLPQLEFALNVRPYRETRRIDPSQTQIPY